MATAAWPPKADFETLWRYTVQTFQMSLLAIVLAFGTALGAACLAARTANAGVGRRLAAGIVRSLLLMARALPPPVWALMMLFVFYPGALVRGSCAGGLQRRCAGRLMAEAQEEPVYHNLPSGRCGPRERAVGVWLYGVRPRVIPKDLAYGLYRWEVAARETCRPRVGGGRRPRSAAGPPNGRFRLARSGQYADRARRPHLRCRPAQLAGPTLVPISILPNKSILCHAD